MMENIKINQNDMLKNIRTQNNKIKQRSYTMNHSIQACNIDVLSKWIRKKTWKMLVMQRMMVLLYKKCNCIRIMSLNTYNTRVPIKYERK
jgi:hypothetical protein